MSRRVEKTCQFCGSTFYPFIKNVNQGGGKFCSVKCAGKENHKNATGGTTKKALRSYARYSVKELGILTENSQCESCNKVVGLSIDAHHKDRNIRNNNIENIQLLCRSCHVILHNKMKETGRGSKSIDSLPI